MYKRARVSMNESILSKIYNAFRVEINAALFLALKFVWCFLNTNTSSVHVRVTQTHKLVGILSTCPTIRCRKLNNNYTWHSAWTALFMHQSYLLSLFDPFCLNQFLTVFVFFLRRKIQTFAECDFYVIHHFSFEILGQCDMFGCFFVCVFVALFSSVKAIEWYCRHCAYYQSRAHCLISMENHHF